MARTQADRDNPGRWSMSKPTKAQIADRAEYLAQLRDMLKSGDTVYTVLRSVSRSGMNRKLDVYAIQDGRLFRLTYWVAKAIGATYDRKAEALSVSGCGMDMGFHVVYELAATLWPTGFGCIGERCPSNDHSNGDRDRTPHVMGRGCDYDHDHGSNCAGAHWHKTGGYALRQEWL